MSYSITRQFSRSLHPPPSTLHPRFNSRLSAARLEPLERKTPPFVDPPKTNEPAHWAEPKLVVEVKFAEWTADGKLRQPIFLGIRDDKDATDVGLERTSLQEWATAMRRVGAPRARPIASTRGRPVEANGSASAVDEE